MNTDESKRLPTSFDLRQPRAQEVAPVGGHDSHEIPVGLHELDRAAR